MQPSYHRPSPRTALAANSLQTNPTRTNNQRHTSYSDTDPYSDRGPEEEEGDMASADQRNSQKVNQVIQVRTTPSSYKPSAHVPRTSSPRRL